MPIDFPNSPTLNQTFTSGSKTWIYDGEKWLASTTSTPSVQFDTSVGSPSSLEGKLQWNSDFGTLSFGLEGNNSVEQIGINQFAYCYNADTVTLTKGTPVYIFGGQGSQVSIKRALNTSDETSARTLGLVSESIAAGASGYVCTYGVLAGIDTSSYTEGQILYLGATSGTLTTTKPSAPNHYVFIGVVIKADAGGEIWVRPQNGYELDELHNVSAGSPSSGDFLKYDGTLWVNDPINLGTDTVGNYMTDVSAGTGISISHTPSEGSTATITNSGVTSITGTANQITASGSTGSITLSMPSSIVIANNITANENLISNFSSGDEGGELKLAKPQTNTSLAGQISIDVYQNKIRFFENGGSARGFYLDITSGSGGAGTNLSGGGGSTTLDGLTDVTAPTPASGDFLKYNGTAWVNDPIDLSTDTTGSYVASLVAGTGITLTNNSGEGSTPTITNAGVTSINGSTGAITGVVRTSDTGTVTSTMISDGTIVNADINASAGITLSKLASGTAGQIIVANATGVATWVSESGDMTIDSSGVASITSNVIVNADINTAAAIAHSKLANATPGQILLGTTTSGVITATTISGDIAISGAGVATIQANSVALGTDTTGNYVASLVAGTGVTLSNNSGEGATPTVAIGQSVATNSDVAFNSVTAGGVEVGLFSSMITTSSGDLTISPASLKVNIGNNLNVTGNVTVTGSVVDHVVTNQQTASYTLVLADDGKMVEMNVGSANNLTVPADNTVNFPVGTSIDILQVGAGQTTIVPSSGVTINRSTGLKLRTQWSAATLIKRSANTWVAIGDLSA